MDLLTLVHQVSAEQVALVVALTTFVLGVIGLVFGRVDAQRTAKRTAFDMVTTAAAEMREDVRLAREEATSVRLRLLALEAERDALRGRLSVLEGQLDATVQERDTLRARVTQLESEITRLRLTLTGVMERQQHMHAGLRKAVE